MKISDHNFNDFEGYLKHSTENKKMFPSDKIWQNIQKQVQLQKRRPWPELIPTCFVLLILHVFGSLIFHNHLYQKVTNDNGKSPSILFVCAKHKSIFFQNKNVTINSYISNWISCNQMK